MKLMQIPKKPYDVFVSYKSEDSLLADKVVASLQSRGVRVWLDRSQIRPGDLFAQALEDGLGTSRAVVILVTPESLGSKWVQNEYYRALSLANDGQLQLIPLLFRNAELPGFLSTRQFIDFRASEDFELSIDRTVWPGITGKVVHFVAVRCPNYFPGVTRDFESEHPWAKLERFLHNRGLKLFDGQDVDRAQWQIERLLSDGRTRIVVIADPFEGWPDVVPNRDHVRDSPRAYAKFIFDLRESTRGKPREVVFVLYHHSKAWDCAENDLSKTEADRLKRYFAMHYDSLGSNSTFATMWLRVQQELLRTEEPE